MDLHAGYNHRFPSPASKGRVERTPKSRNGRISIFPIRARKIEGIDRLAKSDVFANEAKKSSAKTAGTRRRFLQRWNTTGSFSFYQEAHNDLHSHFFCLLLPKNDSRQFTWIRGKKEIRVHAD